MNQTPTGRSPAPSPDSGEPDGAEEGEPSATTAAAEGDTDGEGAEPGADRDDAAARVPAPRTEEDALPRRTRPGKRQENRKGPSADEDTLHRLLSGLRDI